MAFAKFDRMREKVELAEAQAEALRDLADQETTDVDLSDEPDIDTADKVIESELDALKKKMKN